MFSKFEAWIDILLEANHCDKKWLSGNQSILVKRGSFITSELKLMERWGWSKTKTRAFLKLLQDEKMIVKKSDNKKTTISVVNYGIYQSDETTKEPQKDFKKTSKRLQKDTTKNVKNVKNVKNKKDIYISAQHLSLSKIEYDKLVNAYGEDAVNNKIEYARNYAKLKNYVSLYSTLNNWLKGDGQKPTGKKSSPLDYLDDIDLGD